MRSRCMRISDTCQRVALVARSTFGNVVSVWRWINESSFGRTVVETSRERLMELAGFYISEALAYRFIAPSVASVTGTIGGIVGNSALIALTLFAYMKSVSFCLQHCRSSETEVLSMPSAFSIAMPMILFSILYIKAEPYMVDSFVQCGMWAAERGTCFVGGTLGAYLGIFLSGTDERLVSIHDLQRTYMFKMLQCMLFVALFKACQPIPQSGLEMIEGFILSKVISSVSFSALDIRDAVHKFFSYTAHQT